MYTYMYLLHVTLHAFISCVHLLHTAGDTHYIYYTQACDRLQSLTLEKLHCFRSKGFKERSIATNGNLLNAIIDSYK